MLHAIKIGFLQFCPAGEIANWYIGC